MFGHAHVECKECARRSEEQKKRDEEYALKERATASFYHLFDVMTRRSRDVLMEKYNELVPEEKKICVESFIYGHENSISIDYRVMQEATEILGVRFSIYSNVKRYCFKKLAKDYEIPKEPMGFKELRKNFGEIFWDLSILDTKHIFKVMKRFLKNELDGIERVAFHRDS